MSERARAAVLAPELSEPGARRTPFAFAGGAAIGALGGLIGLGGAEFRLPLLIGAFRFAALQAVILNKAMSLVVVASALPFRASAVPFSAVAAHWLIIVNLLCGSLLGAWFGAGWATRLASQSLYRVIAILLVGIAGVLLLGHDVATSGALLTGIAQAVAGIAVGFAIGVVAALLGVAGGELLIPTLILLFGVDIKLAGSLSLAVSLPTMLVGFARYSRDRSFVVLRENRRFVLVMAAGSIVGSFIGGRLLGIVPSPNFAPAARRDLGDFGRQGVAALAARLWNGHFYILWFCARSSFRFLPHNTLLESRIIPFMTNFTKSKLSPPVNEQEFEAWGGDLTWF